MDKKRTEELAKEMTEVIQRVMNEQRIKAEKTEDYEAAANYRDAVKTGFDQYLNSIRRGAIQGKAYQPRTPREQWVMSNIQQAMAWAEANNAAHVDIYDNGVAAAMHEANGKTTIGQTFGGMPVGEPIMNGPAEELFSAWCHFV